MDRNTKIIIAAVVLAALSFGVYSQYKKDTVMGTSACPVTKMIGRSDSARTSASCRSSPLWRGTP